MAAGDVTSVIVHAEDGTTTINAAIKAVRAAATDFLSMASTGVPGEILVVCVEQ